MDAVEGRQKEGVIMDGKFWRTMYDPNGAFELRISNKSGAALPACSLGFNNRFFHSLTGLRARKGDDENWITLKNDMIENDEIIRITINHESGNLDLFQITDYTFKKPKTVELVAGKDTLQWNFTLQLKQGYF
ncbi:MAG: hypothetical protein V2A54_12305 [Bacteroidota bacterium]